MGTCRNALYAAAFLLALASFASPAQAQKTKFLPLPEDRWDDLNAGDVGKAVSLDGRWEQVYGAYVLLYKPAADIKGLLFIQQGALKDNLTRDLSTDNERLERKQSMVRVNGFVRSARGRVYIHVEEVHKLPDEDQQFRERLAQLGDDPATIQALGEECAQRAARYDDARLAAVTREILARELEVRRAGLQADDHAQRLQLAKRYLEEVKAPRGAIELYAEVVESGTAADAERHQGEAGLQRLQAIRTRQVGPKGEVSWSWVPYAEFKASEGFIERTQDGRTTWVRQELAELEDARAAELQRQKGRIDPPRLDPRKAVNDARAKRLSRGQTFAEVRRAAGLPVRVLHVIAAFDAVPDAVWSQWILSDGRRAYFLSGELISFQAADQPWPSR